MLLHNWLPWLFGWFITLVFCAAPLVSSLLHLLLSAARALLCWRHTVYRLDAMLYSCSGEIHWMVVGSRNTWLVVIWWYSTSLFSLQNGSSKLSSAPFLSWRVFTYLLCLSKSLLLFTAWYHAPPHQCGLQLHPTWDIWTLLIPVHAGLRGSATWSILLSLGAAFTTYCFSLAPSFGLFTRSALDYFYSTD